MEEEAAHVRIHSGFRCLSPTVGDDAKDLKEPKEVKSIIESMYWRGEYYNPRSYHIETRNIIQQAKALEIFIGTTESEILQRMAGIRINELMESIWTPTK